MKVITSILLLLACSFLHAQEIMGGGISHEPSQHHQQFKELLTFAGVNYVTKNVANTEYIYWPLAEDDKVNKIRNLYYDGSYRTKAAVSKALGDLNKYQSFLTLAAENGDSIAQQNLGVELLIGTNIKQDYASSKKWLEKAVSNGNLGATNSLVYIYEKGLGVKKDLQKAKSLLIKSAEAGNSFSICNLINHYKNGVGAFGKDQTLVEKWENKIKSSDIKCP
ncbi:MAG: tetratricopeptide repeat protein [Candidatus Sedimenticola sp. (ex Thyasira tokunagai)]